MLSNFSQHPPQGLMSQFPGLQGAGWPQMSPGLFGQPGAYSGSAPFGYEPGQAGMSQNPFLQNPFTQNQFSLSPFATSPLGYNPLLSSFAGYAGAHNPAQQVVLVLGQLAQQISVQSALIQQISIALQQLVHQLAVQSLQSHQGGGLGLGAGQPLGVGGPFFGSLGGQYFGQNPFASATQGGYGGFSPQAQSWGANRAQTIQ
jgi:hypothetical protein